MFTPYGRMCDRCHKKLKGPTSYVWNTISSKKKTKMHFCSYRCQLVFFRGRAYYQRKLQHMRDHKAIADAKASIVANSGGGIRSDFTSG